MSHRTSLETQTAKINLVIRKNKEIDLKIIEAHLKEVATKYAFIEHKGDIEPITGIVEGVHYHIIYDAKEKRQRLGKILNDWTDFLGFSNNDGIQIEKYLSLEGSLQYLIHKNNPEKTKHDVKEIITNIEPGELNTYLICDLFVLSFDYVYSLCSSCENICEVIKALGLANYHRYRATIWDIWEVLHKKRLCEKHFKGEVIA